MRALVFEPHGIVAPNLEIALDVIQGLLEQGAEVVWIGCDKDLLACDGNIFHSASRCAKCVERREQGAALLVPRIPMTSLLRFATAEDRQAMEALPRAFATQEELVEFRIDGFELGESVASTLISLCRSPRIDLDAHRRTIHDLLRSAFLVYRAVRSYLAANRIDKVFISNGRYAIPRAALRACESRGVPYVVRDAGRDPNHLEVYENATAFDVPYGVRLIRQRWERADPEERVAAADRFFRARAAGGGYVAAQRPGLLPPGFDPGMHNVAIFNSSEDEFAAIGPEWKNPFYRDQLEGLARIRAAVPSLPESVRLFLRIHPSLRGHPAAHELAKLDGPRFTVIAPEAETSSYALLKACRSAVTFGSTIGIEAVFWGVPSILAGRCFYGHLGGTYNPRSHEELLELLPRSLEPMGREPALVYGYYLATYGVPYKFCAFGAPDTGTFKGRRLEWSNTTHYSWALVHRIPPLNRVLDRRFSRETYRKVVSEVGCDQ